MLASVAASRNSCARVTADHEVSKKVFEEESKALADVTEISAVEGHTYSLSQKNSSTDAHTTVDLKGFEDVTMVRRLEEHSAALSQLASSLSGGPNAGKDPLADVKEAITDLITDNRLQSEASSEANHKADRGDSLRRTFPSLRQPF